MVFQKPFYASSENVIGNKRDDRNKMTNLTINILAFIIFIGTTSLRQPDCSPTDFTKLKDKKLQDNFFTQLDSVKKVQYPKNDQDTKNAVDLTPKMLNQFLKDFNLETFKKTGIYENYYFFNISPPQFKDSKICKDKISVQYFSESCTYRMIVENVYIVENNCIGGQQVSYNFKIIKNKIVDFGRDEAG